MATVGRIPGAGLAVGRQRTYGLIAAMAASAVVMAGVSPISAVLPFLSGQFAAPVQTASWILTLYLLFLTVFVLPAGRWGDLFGDRRVLVAGTLLALATAVLAGLAPTLPLLLVVRGLQGLAAALCGASGLALVSRLFPREQLGRVVGAVSLASSLMMMAGTNLSTRLVLAGLWRWTFWLAVPVALVGLWAALHLHEDTTRRSSGGMDWWGTALLMAALAALSLSFNHLHGGEASFADGMEWHGAMQALAAVLFAAFFLVQRRTASPLLPMAHFGRPTFLAPLGAHTLLHMTMMGSMASVPFMVQYGLGLDATYTGWALTTSYLTSVVMAPISGWLYDRTRSPWLPFLSLLILGSGMALLGALSTHVTFLALVVLIAYMGIGVGLFMTANNATLLNAVPSHLRGFAAGTMEMTRQMGHTLGATITGTTLSAGVAAVAQPGGVASLSRSITVTWSVMAVVCAVGALLSLRLVWAARQSAARTPPGLTADALPTQTD